MVNIFMIFSVAFPLSHVKCWLIVLQLLFNTCAYKYCFYRSNPWQPFLNIVGEQWHQCCLSVIFQNHNTSMAVWSNLFYISLSLCTARGQYLFICFLKTFNKCKCWIGQKHRYQFSLTFKSVIHFFFCLPLMTIKCNGYDLYI